MNKTARISISLPAPLAARVRKAAKRERSAVSAWVMDAAEKKLLLESARTTITAYERENGKIEDRELAAVKRAWRE